METIDHFLGCLLGLAVGDAVGTTLEFKSRGRFTPINDMVGGGPFGLEPGQWTDDTSMALCLADSLLECGGFDPADQMRRYCRWMDDGYLSSNGHCFDIGNTVRSALAQFQQTGEPFSGSTHPRSAGNGCIMRLAPVPMYYFTDVEAAMEQSAQSSRTTHGAEECLECCRVLAWMLCRALAGASCEDVLFSFPAATLKMPKVREIAEGAYRAKTESQIRGSGYVVQCLEAAAWCFLTTGDFAGAVLQAANLGDDADTTAAVAGQIAGAFYGVGGIRGDWLDKLAQRELIVDMARKIHGRTGGAIRLEE